MPKAWLRHFITICSHEHRCFFGKVVGEEMQLSQMGEIAEQCWDNIPNHFQNVELDEFVIMPNHLHGIIVITECRDLINQIPTMNNFPFMINPNQSLRKIVRYYKARVTKFIHDIGYSNFRWQPLYFDRIIRNDKELNFIRDYIINNPIQWTFDSYHEIPDNFIYMK